MAQPPKFFFAIFRLLGSIGNHQRVGFWRNMKKSQNHCTLLYSFLSYLHLLTIEPMTTGGESYPEEINLSSALRADSGLNKGLIA